MIIVELAFLLAAIAIVLFTEYKVSRIKNDNANTKGGKDEVT